VRRVDKRGGGDWGIKGGQLRIQGELKGSLRGPARILCP